ncbi:hypothetical protein BKA65DRAFT_493428 [Rhexocercosporidium sp. MPI-PUGE-AT-0058]|nr:hypothetical protein BKA65DRAFT_493428 [Rhexocercosporidium sp. MPI-PUGE-AT-0058]
MPQLLGISSTWENLLLRRKARSRNGCYNWGSSPGTQSTPHNSDCCVLPISSLILLLCICIDRFINLTTSTSVSLNIEKCLCRLLHAPWPRSPATPLCSPANTEVGCQAGIQERPRSQRLFDQYLTTSTSLAGIGLGTDWITHACVAQNPQSCMWRRAF